MIYLFLLASINCACNILYVQIKSKTDKLNNINSETTTICEQPW